VNPFAEYLVDALLGETEIDPEELRKGTKDEEKEHDMTPKKAKKTALQHLHRVDPKYYTKTEKCLGESQSCECRDPGCPACRGKCNNSASVNLRRIDMEDRTGTFFCNKCASDALDAGTFGGPDRGAYIRGYGRTPRIKPAPKADILPGSDVGGSAGDSTAIGGGGSAAGV
jgi:hypothetical protein